MTQEVQLVQTCEEDMTIANECNQQEFEIRTSIIKITEQESVFKTPGSTG